jgi:Uma2 family endonuclease
MNAVASNISYTADDLLAMPDEKDYELVEGALIERKSSTLSSWVAGELFALIRSFCQTNPCGWVMPEGSGYQCFPATPNKVRKPDASFIRAERLPLDAQTSGYLRIRPDLAVEVISPNDLAYEIDEKLDEYLAVGAPLIWIVHPATRSVLVYRDGARLGRLKAEDELTGEDMIPGFRCRVADLFPPWAGDRPEDAPAPTPA